MTGFAFPGSLGPDLRAFRRWPISDGAFDLFDAYLPLIRYEQQPGVGLAIRKAILHRRGVLASPRVRPPGAKVDADDRRELDLLLERLDRRMAALGFEAQQRFDHGAQAWCAAERPVRLIEFRYR